MAIQPVLAVLGLSDPLAGVVLGWALATVTAATSTIGAIVRRRVEAGHRQRASARLILEELGVSQRAVERDDARLAAGAAPLPTDVWTQRREDLLGCDEWYVIADAFAEIDELNHRRTAQATWRVEETARDLLAAREAIKPKLNAAADALERIAKS